MLEQNIFFMAGFPRAGSTLLMNILAENPRFHGSPTSGLITSLIQLKDNWKNSPLYLSNGEEYIYPKIKGMMRGMLEGFYQKELSQGIIPIDKNRAWTGNFELLDEIFDTKVKFIFPIRHVIDCLISLEKIDRKSALIKMPTGTNGLTTIGRAETALGDEGMFGLPLTYLREILYRKEWDRLILVPFDDLLNYPEPTMKRLYYQMGIEYFEHDLNNVKQTIYEEDIHHGYAPDSLHKIKEGKLLPPNPRDSTIYDSEFIKTIETQRYKDITDFIATNIAKP